MEPICYACDECHELFERRASMAKADAYSKEHRVRCPSCGSEKTRRVTAKARASGKPSGPNAKKEV